MKSLRLALTLLLAPLLAGCRTAGVGDLTRRDLLPSRAAESAAALLVDHNRNAGRVQSVEARPSISVANRRARSMAGVNGRLAMERPRNFKLVMQGPAMMGDVADIGSNDEEFWFWVKDSPQKAVYYCHYDESGTSPLAAGFQPDWIVEALGLRVFSDEDAASIRVTRGDQPGTLLLTQRQDAGRGQTIIKETVLGEADRRIREHRVYSADHKVLLARAQVFKYESYPVPGEPGDARGTVYLPARFQLEWPREKLALDVTLNKVSVNAFDPSRRSDLFVEPAIAGTDRVNLADRSAASGGPTSVRETMPAPPRVRLSDPTSEPAPVGVDDARRLPRDPVELAADLPPSYARGVAEVVGPPIPTAADPPPDAARTRPGWPTALGPAVER
jgi:hypothetical protein